MTTSRLCRRNSDATPGRIVAMDPWGATVADVFANELAAGYDIRPTIAVTQAHVILPEVIEALQSGRLKADGKFLTAGGAAMVTKVAVEPVCLKAAPGPQAAHWHSNCVVAHRPSTSSAMGRCFEVALCHLRICHCGLDPQSTPAFGFKYADGSRIKSGMTARV